MMNRASRTTGFEKALRTASVCAAAALLMGTWPAGCALPQPSPVDPVALAAAETRAANQTRYERLPPLASPEYDSRTYDPSPRIQAETRRTERGQTGEAGLQIPTTQPTTQSATRPTTQSARVIYLPLQECVRRATLNNFAVAVAGYQPAIAETRVIEALARYDPTFRLTGEYQEQTGVNPAENVFGDTKRLTLTTALSQLLPSGGTVELEYRALRNDLEAVSLFQPAGTTWTSDLSLQLTQPLLRDFGFDVNRARIFVNRNDHRISILEFRLRLEEILIQVEQTYWQLYRAQRLVEIRQDLLERTVELAERLRIRGIKDATRADIAQALSQVKQREADLVEAKSVVGQLSDQLKALMNDADLPIGSSVLLMPASGPVLEPLLFDLESAMAVAMLHRAELSQQILRIINAGRVLRVAESNRLPRLDLLLSGGFAGSDDEDDYMEAVSEQFEFDNLNVGVGLQLEIPIGNRQARAVLRRTRFERESAVTQYQAILKQVTLEVSQSQRELMANYARIGILREGRLAARDLVEQAELLEKSGRPLDPQFSDLKLRYLAEYAQAQSLEVQAITDYNISLADYERAKGTLLRYYNVVLEEAALNQKLPVGENTRKRR